MSHLKTTLLCLLGLLLPGFVLAVPPDFNADRRVNVKCPCKIDYDFVGQFEVDGFKRTLRRLYHELEKNLLAAERQAVEGSHGDGYTFSDDPGSGIFFVCHAKASFPEGRLTSFYPPADLIFREVFYIMEIDWERNRVRLARQRDRKRFVLDMVDFEKAFLWYNALLDKHRAFIPLYGFLSLPGEADDFPTIWDGVGGTQKGYRHTFRKPCGL